MRKSIFTIVLLAVLATTHAHAGAPPVRLEFRQGEAATVELKHWDKTECSLKVKRAKRDEEHLVGELLAIRFDPADTTDVREAARAEQDEVVYLDGRVVDAVIKEIRPDRIVTWIPGNPSEDTHETSRLRRVVFGARVLDVDRREFGNGWDFYSASDEVALGRQAFKGVASENPILADGPVNAYLDSLGKRIAAASRRPDLPWSFHVVETKEVNAFTPGGGQVFIYRGLLQRMHNEAELAGVLAHEIGHNVARHPTRLMTKAVLLDAIASSAQSLLSKGRPHSTAAKVIGVTAQLIALKYSRDDEREADYLATYNLYHMGLDPNGMITAFQTLKQSSDESPDLFSGFFDTHPSLDERISNVSTELRKITKSNLAQDSPGFHAALGRLATLPWALRHVLIANDTLQVAAMDVAAYRISPNDSIWTDLSLRGRIRAYGGSGNDIRVLFMREDDYLNWVNGHASGKPLYDSGQITVTEPQAPIDGHGPYVLVLDNRFSLFTPKTVTMRLELGYHER